MNIKNQGYILRLVDLYGHIGDSPNPIRSSTILKTLQKGLASEHNEKPLSRHSHRVGATMDLLEQSEPLEKMMRRS